MDGLVVTQDESCTALVKLARTADALQRVVAAVDGIGATITAMTARRSLDGQLFYLTLELAHAPDRGRVEQAVHSVAGVRGVEIEARAANGKVRDTSGAPFKIDLGRAYT